MLEKGEIKDPRIGFVTVTGVDLSPDLRQCRVYFSLMGSKHRQDEATKGLQSAAGFISTEIGRRLQLKYAPAIEFKYDRTVETGARISKVIHDLHQERSEDD